MMTLARAHALLPGSVLFGDGATAVERVHSDTRSLRPGDLFVALRGERFDGHDFLPQARAAGAVAALAESGLGAAMPGLQVPDTLLALQQLAAAWRAQFELPLIAVTGSNGKTTVTQMIASMLAAWHGHGMLATAGNLNNHIGVPLTLLRLRQDEETWHHAAVLELGMNHPGEIALLARLAAPTVALVNNAQREHQEFMASVEAVARENGSVIQALGADGTAVMPADDAFTPLWRELAGARRVISFAAAGRADITASAAWHGVSACWDLTLHTPAGSATTTLHQAGRHNLHNALAASAAALAAGAPLEAVAQGLARFLPAVRAAIAVLAARPAPRWLVLGDMGEVGAQGPAFHAEVGAHARRAGIEQVWTAGTLAAHVGGHRHFDSVEALLDALVERPPAASVLVKGSRFMKMERVVQALKAAHEREAGDAA